MIPKIGYNPGLSSYLFPSHSAEETEKIEETALPPSQFDIDLQALNDQTSALEIGEKGLLIGEKKFDRYEKLIRRRTKTLFRKYRQILEESDPSVRRAELQDILSDLKLINRAREDFAMLIQRDYGVDLDVAKTKGRDAIIAVVHDYKQSLDKVEAIHKELSNLSKRIALHSYSSDSNPRYEEDEATRNSSKLKDELQILVQGVASDKEFLSRLHKKSLKEAAKKEGIYQYRGWWIDPITLREHRFEAERTSRRNDEKFNKALALSKKDPATLTKQEKDILRAVEKEEGYKKNVYRVLLMLHAVSWGVSAYRTYYHDAPLLKAQAVILHEEIKNAVPQKIVDKIDKETCFLNDRLSRDYENVKSGNFSSVHRERYPLAIQALEKYSSQYPDRQPTDAEIAKYCDAFNFDLLIKNSSHPYALPFRSLSPSEWWKTFTTEQGQIPKTDPHEQIGERSPKVRIQRNADFDVKTSKAARLILDHHADRHAPAKADRPFVFASAGEERLTIIYPTQHSHHIDSVKYILAAQAWEIGGAGKIGNKIILREGSNPHIFSKEMIQTLTHFHESYPEEMTEEEYEFLRSTMIEGTDYRETQNMASMIQRYLAGFPITIHTGFTEHAVEMIIWNEYIIINNKGGESRRPIEIYRMNSAKIIPTSEFAAKVGEIIGLNKKQQSDYVTWLNAVCDKFGATKSDFEKIFEESYPLERDQKVGNCSWESLETSIYALIAIHRMVSKGFTKGLARDGKLSEAQTREISNELQNSGRVFIRWLQFTMLSALEGYLNHHKEPDDGAIPLDHDLITKIILQSQLLPAWQIDLYPKMNRLIQQYLSRNDFVEKGIGDPENNPEGSRLFDLLVAEGRISNERIFGFVEKAVSHPETDVAWRGLMLIAPLMAKGTLSDVQLYQLRLWIEKAVGTLDVDLDTTDEDAVKKGLDFIHMLEKKESLSDDQVEQVFVFAVKAIGNQHEFFARKCLDCIAPLVEGGRLSVEQVAVLIETTLEHSHRDIAKKGLDFIDILMRKASLIDFLTGKRSLIDFLTGKGPFSDEQIIRYAMKAILHPERIFIEHAFKLMTPIAAKKELSDEHLQVFLLLDKAFSPPETPQEINENGLELLSLLEKEGHLSLDQVFVIAKHILKNKFVADKGIDFIVSLFEKKRLSDQQITTLIEISFENQNNDVVKIGFGFIYILRMNQLLSDKMIYAMVEKAIDQRDEQIVGKSLHWFDTLRTKGPLSDEQVGQVFNFALKMICKSDLGIANKGLDYITQLIDGKHLKSDQIEALSYRVFDQWPAPANEEIRLKLINFLMIKGLLMERHSPS